MAALCGKLPPVNALLVKAHQTQAHTGFSSENIQPGIRVLEDDYNTLTGRILRHPPAQVGVQEFLDLSCHH